MGYETTATLIARARSELVEPSEGFFTDVELLRWFNDGLREFSLHGFGVEDRDVRYAVGGQQGYRLPELLIPGKIHNVEFSYSDDDWYPLTPRNMTALMAMGNTLGQPQYWSWYRNCLYLYPIPKVVAEGTALLYAYEDAMYFLMPNGDRIYLFGLSEESYDKNPLSLTAGSGFVTTTLPNDDVFYLAATTETGAVSLVFGEEKIWAKLPSGNRFSLAAVDGARPAGVIRMSYGKDPAVLEEDDDGMELADIFTNGLVGYVGMRGLRKDRQAHSAEYKEYKADFENALLECRVLYIRRQEQVANRTYEAKDYGWEDTEW